MKIKAINGKGYQLDTQNDMHDPLDGKQIINHFGEPLHTLNGIVDAILLNISGEQMRFSGINHFQVYQII